ncbi:SMC family ATPase [Fodinibacter luteus]|uniref:Nuclease SbcCD subunit C n=1 Tax=Fodinibacter luteus TaxID=552064 RepID=A0ABP8KFQ2_9MICO
MLDAICFALYADVPGSRSKRGLRSDHAASDAVPCVTLELTAGVRRFRIRRSPEFHRPKKRGTGLLKVQASVTLEEHLGGRWVAVSTRHDEVADVVKDVLGMGMDQFAKVVLLPQGEFAAFLRSTPEDRREVLERLFDISAFSDVEAWLAEARRASGADLEQARSALATELARVEDVLADAGPTHTDLPAAAPVDLPAAAPVDLPPGPPADLSVPVLSDLPPGAPVDRPVPALADLPVADVPGHLGEVARHLDARVTATMAAFDTASTAERAAADALAAGRSLDDLRVRGTRARTRLLELEAARSTHLGHVAALGAAERAAALAGHLAAHERAVDDEASARARSGATRDALRPTPLADVADREVGPLLRRLHDLDETVASLAREAEDTSARAHRRAELEARCEALRTRAAELRLDLDTASTERDGLRAEVEARAAGAGRVAGLELLLSATRERLAQLDAADDDLARAAALAPRRSALREAALDRRSELLDLRQRRLDGMAGELARSLAEGDPCPVCGGTEHPDLATVSDPVLPSDLDTAEARLEAADAGLRAVDAEAEALTTRARTRHAALGGASRDTLEADVAQGLSRLAAAREDAAAHRALTSRLAGVDATVDEHLASLAAATAHAEAASALLLELDRADEVASTKVAELRREHAGCPCGSDDPSAHSRAARLLDDHRAAVAELAAARTRAGAAQSALDAAMSAAGFDAPDRAREALLPDDEVARLRARVATHDQDASAARAVAEDPEVAAALVADPPDLEALRAAERAARDELLTAAAAQEDAARTLRALERLLPLVDTACTALVTATEHDARVRDLADTTSGTGPDNTLRMRLTSYVLAARLEKVATLANERLAVMGGGRYVLEHSDERAARGARSGLGLRVHDQWTGRVRDTATLSGGESFMASLALALGLADAVREEAGGLDLGTLFIDEGFGSLDEDSLEQVLTVLDGLREGGRAVGVVSHVADLRARITHQAVVHKGASGSSVEVRTGRRADEPAA